MSKIRILITIPTVNHISYFLALRLRAARLAASTIYPSAGSDVVLKSLPEQGLA